MASQYPTYQVPENFAAEWLHYNQTEADELYNEMVEVTDDVSPSDHDSVEPFNLVADTSRYVNRNRYIINQVYILVEGRFSFGDMVEHCRSSDGPETNICVNRGAGESCSLVYLFPASSTQRNVRVRM